MTFEKALRLTQAAIADTMRVPTSIMHGTPRTWSLCMTSENHGTVGPAGCTFSHAPEKHERVQVVEIVAAGSPPAPGVDLAGLVRFDFSDLDGENEQFGEVADGAYFLAHQVEARCASAAPVAAQAGQVAVPLPAGQPMIGKLLDQFSELPVLWGLNEPGALVRHSDVFKMLVAAGKAAQVQASTSGERQEGGA